MAGPKLRHSMDKTPPPISPPAGSGFYHPSNSSSNVGGAGADRPFWATGGGGGSPMNPAMLRNMSEQSRLWHMQMQQQQHYHQQQQLQQQLRHRLPNPEQQHCGPPSLPKTIRTAEQQPMPTSSSGGCGDRGNHMPSQQQQQRHQLRPSPLQSPPKLQPHCSRYAAPPPPPSNSLPDYNAAAEYPTPLPPTSAAESSRLSGGRSAISPPDSELYPPRTDPTRLHKNRYFASTSPDSLLMDDLFSPGGGGDTVVSNKLFTDRQNEMVSADRLEDVHAATAAAHDPASLSPNRELYCKAERNGEDDKNAKGGVGGRMDSMLPCPTSMDTQSELPVESLIKREVETPPTASFLQR